MWADRDQVRAALGREDVRLVNALPAEIYRGEGAVVFGRRGHIPTSVNVSYRDYVDEATNRFLPTERLRATFAAAGATDAEHVVTYCGSGISACADALVLTTLGVDDVAVYDGSMMEWGADPSLQAASAR